MDVLFRRLPVATLIIGSMIAAPFSWADDSVSRSHEMTLKDVSVRGGILHPSQHSADRASGYFTVHNAGPSDLLLDGITSPLCTTVSSNHSNQEMAQISGGNDDIFQHLAIPHQATMVFPAAGYHLLCRGIRTMPKDGETVPFTFHFLNEGSISTSFTVRTQANKIAEH